MRDLAFNLCVGLGGSPTPTLTRAGPFESSLFYTWGGEGGTLSILFVKKNVTSTNMFESHRYWGESQRRGSSPSASFWLPCKALVSLPGKRQPMLPPGGHSEVGEGTTSTPQLQHYSGADKEPRASVGTFLFWCIDPLGLWDH